jgi:hypothetical protein
MFLGRLHRGVGATEQDLGKEDSNSSSSTVERNGAGEKARNGIAENIRDYSVLL